MQCIYGHAPGTCDCMLTDAEIDAARAALAKGNADARAARDKVKGPRKSLEDRLFERSQKAIDERPLESSTQCALGRPQGSGMNLGAVFILMMAVFFLVMINVLIRVQ